jgi:hypothetical protein
MYNDRSLAIGRQQCPLLEAFDTAVLDVQLFRVSTTFKLCRRPSTFWSLWPAVPSLA